MAWRGAARKAHTAQHSMQGKGHGTTGTAQSTARQGQNSTHGTHGTAHGTHDTVQRTHSTGHMAQASLCTVCRIQNDSSANSNC